MRLGRSVRTLGLALVIAASAATSVSAATRSPDAERALASYTNRERVAFGLNALRYSRELTAVARAHAMSMADAGRIWHQEDLAWAVSGWKHVGDNVGRSGSVEHLHSGFMSSPSHRDNLLFREYTQFGVGVVAADDGWIYGVVIFMTPARSARRSTSAKAVSTTTDPTVASDQTPDQTLGMLMQILALDGPRQAAVPSERRPAGG